MPTRIILADDHGLVRQDGRSLLGARGEISRVMAKASDGGTGPPSARLRLTIRTIEILDISMRDAERH